MNLNDTNFDGGEVDSFKTDPVEQSPKYLAIADELQQLIDERFPPDEYFIGRCTQIWDYKKRLLRERYGIRWRSPLDLNPGLCFD